MKYLIMSMKRILLVAVTCWFLGGGGDHSVWGFATTTTTTTSRSVATTKLSNNHQCPRSTVPLMSLQMSYLDSLSSGGNQQDNNNDNNSPKSSDVPKWKPTSGGIPSGRGPQRSYLDIMTNPSLANNNDNDNNNSDGMAASATSIPSQDDSTLSSSTSPFTKKMPKSWSNVYLSDVLKGKDDSRTDVRNLLTQRAIQSFMYYLEQCRDPHSAKWIQEDFLQTGNLLDYHGTGAGFIERFGGTWDQPLKQMIDMPKSQIVIAMKRRGRGHQGWSKNNPYLEERFVEYTIDVNPTSLCERIMSVREQIAEEWIEDLDIVLTANKLLLDSYFDKSQSQRSENSLLQDIAFDRVAMDIFYNRTRFAEVLPSPYRRANFDLLYALATQAAIHRILREYIQNDETSNVGFKFLQEFYTSRVDEYFDGNQPYGRADDFMEELLETTPSIISGGKGLIDPLGTAARIIRVRSDVATEWMERMKLVPQQDHMKLRQALLNKRMEASSSYESSVFSTTSETEQSSSASQSDSNIDAGFQ